MRHVTVVLALLAAWAARAEDGGSSVDTNQILGPQPSFSNSLATANADSTSKGQERAKDERTFKDFVAYDAIQNVLINALKPKPIVDTASESEKAAPNVGSPVQGLGEFFVKGTETLSRALTSAIDVPKKAITRLSAGATQALNQLGAYLVGL